MTPESPVHLFVSLRHFVESGFVLPLSYMVAIQVVGIWDSVQYESLSRGSDIVAAPELSW